MQQFSKWNNGYRYLLMALDVFSKYGLIEPLRDKKGETVAAVFEKMFRDGRKPKFLWVDKGKEFYKKFLKELLEKDGIPTENEEKSSVWERWKRTIKTKMWKKFTVQGNMKYLDILPEILKKYNNTKHSSIKMTPTDASKMKTDQGTGYSNLYGNMDQLSAKPKFKVGDKVRISNYKRKVFDKGYTPNWTEEILKVDDIQYTKPVTQLKDINDEEITGSLYEPKLLKLKQDVFRIEKVFRSDYKKKLAMVKW